MFRSSQWVKEERKSLGLTQVGLTKKANIFRDVGVIKQWEAGSQLPGEPVIKAVAEYFRQRRRDADSLLKLVEEDKLQHKTEHLERKVENLERDYEVKKILFVKIKSPQEFLKGIELRRDFAIERLYNDDWLGFEEIVDSFYDDMRQPSFNRECRTETVKALLIILGIAKSLNRKVFDNISSDERQFEIMKSFGEMRVNELNLLKVKSFRHDLSIEDMRRYYSPEDIPILDLDSRKRQAQPYNRHSQGKYFIDFQAIDEEAHIDIVNHWINRLVEGERIEKTEIAHILHCLYYLFPQSHQKQVANTLLDNVFKCWGESDTECALWEQWQSVRSLEPYVPLFDCNMKASLGLVRDKHPDRIIQLGAEIVLAEKMTKDLLEKISRIVIENVSSSDRYDVKTCHVYIYAGYEFLNFIQRFLRESEEILSFEVVQDVIEEILRCDWIPPKVAVPMIISSIHHRLNDADKQQARRCLGDFLDESQQYDEVEEIRQVRALSTATMLSLN